MIVPYTAARLEADLSVPGTAVAVVCDWCGELVDRVDNLDQALDSWRQHADEDQHR